MMKLIIKEVKTKQEFEQVQYLRRFQTSVFRENNFYSSEISRDKNGIVLLVMDPRRPVATFRLTQTGRGMTCVERVNGIENVIPISEAWELGRFVVHPGYRNLKNLRRIYKATSSWLTENRKIQFVVSMCKPRVAALLERLVLNKLLEHVEIDGQPTDYSVFGASVEDINQRFGKVNSISKSTEPNTSFDHDLNQVIKRQWQKNKRGAFFKLIREQKIDPKFYAMLMIELYHYTRHNSINQAVSSFIVPEEADRLLKFVVVHAREELGHEKMVIRDLQAVGLFQPDMLKQAPLPATEALVNYLYAVALRYGAVARLGFSAWAEDSYDYVREVISKIRSDLALEDEQLSFLVAHEKIDVHHARQVREALSKYCRNPNDRRLVLIVAQTTLFLFGKMLDDVAERYLESVC